MVAAFTQGGMLPDGLDFVQAGDMAAIAVPTDFLGVNYYTRKVMKAQSEEQPFPVPAEELATLPRTEMDWEVYPDGLYNLLCRLYFNYGMPKLYVTENGCSYADGPGEDGARARRPAHGLSAPSLHGGAPCHPGRRPAGGLFRLVAYGQLRVGQGLPAALRHRVGRLATQQRTLKDSALWYRGVIAANGM